MPNSFIFLRFVIIFAIFTNNTQGFRLLQASISPSFQHVSSNQFVLAYCVNQLFIFHRSPRRDFFCVIIFLSVLVSPVDYMCFYCSCIFCFIIFFFLYSLFAQQISTLRFLLCIYQMILLCSSSKGFYSTFHYFAYLGFNLLVFNSSFCCYRKITTIRR